MARGANAQQVGERVGRAMGIGLGFICARSGAAALEGARPRGEEGI
jgi:hypothetical protein